MTLARDEPGARQRTLMPWRAAVQTARAAAVPLAGEQVALEAAVGRVLAAPVCAGTSLPRFDTAAMDGYAVTGPGPWRLIGQVLAGGPPWAGAIRAGEAVEIMTGAVVPGAAMAVVPYEDVRRDGGFVHADLGAKPHIRRAGEDAKAGDELLASGRLVTPAVAGLLAECGTDRVAVRRRPRIRLVVTGDEVVPAGTPGPGQVRDVFGPMLSALIAACGATVAGRVLLDDDPDLLADQVRGQGVDVVVVTGSSSAGAADHLRGVLTTLGARYLVDQVACRPGRPQTLAALPDGRWVVGLPGNPFAGLVASITLLRPLLQALTGWIPPAPVRLPVTGDARVTDPFTRLVPVTLAGDHAVIVAGSRPASLGGAATADALAVLEPGWVTGRPVDLLPLP
ncbi:molybdopterin molybdotransferase MoeA [Winogradskya humida]|uniref:molybdopterin molybdotransferase MoeA n=1 Tax=Winogradskya humida TaxID=113566 RepID=UPI001940E11A|nr:molybdopterin molybdotransferase MoeA [Actinoplanes humidus]